MRRLCLIALPVLALAFPCLAGDPLPVTITIDASAPATPLNPIWRYCGYDEPNFTYAPNGRKLVHDFADAARPFAPAAFRTHSLLCTGDGTGGGSALKWGSTNIYTEDPAGKPVYDFTVVDRIFDTYLDAGGKPLVQIGFMPKALSTHPDPYQHHWKPGDNYNDIYTGWAYPPNDYDKWRELVYQWASHCVQKYGREQVESWFWEVWNEPNIPYWKGKPEEYDKLYDYAADGLKRALPTARIGGAEIAGGGSRGGIAFQRQFLQHVLTGTNYATGKQGSPLDMISFHAKGSPQNVNGHVRMGISNHLRDIDGGFATVEEFPALREVPIIIGESDPDGCAACPEKLYPQNAYRNGTLYAAYTIEQLTRTLDLAQRRHVRLEGAVTWAFEMEDQPIFGGFRVLATNGVNLPVFNTFRMLGMMGHRRLPVASTGDLGLDTLRTRGARGDQPDVHALAARDDRRVTVIAWNYHDEDLPGPEAAITLDLSGLPADLSAARLTEYRIDASHANAYTVWKQMGSPEKPDPAQYQELQKASQLAPLGPPAQTAVRDGRASLTLHLPRQALSLIELAW